MGYEEHKVVVVPDDPTDIDAFGAHAQVALAMADVVLKEKRAVALGLEGGWGSGKSSIVGMLEKQVEADDGTDSRVFVFDAWAHQGDPLRRSFLESLHGAFLAWKWIDKEAWEERLSELSGRKRYAKTKTTSRLTLAGKLAGFAAFLVPIGIVAMSNAESWRAAVVGGALSLAPLIVLATAAAVIAFANRRYRGSRVPTTRLGKLLRRAAQTDPTSVFAQDREEDVDTTSFESGDPTSVEFEMYFENLLREVLTESDSKPRKLIIVFDNLDRIDADDARSIIATMQPFMSGGKGGRQWGNRLWTIVPYDPDGLLRLWHRGALSLETKVEAAGEGDGSAAAVGHAIEARRIADEFPDKLFQVRFSAPPLVLEGWRDFLLAQLQTALPEEDEAELRRVVNLIGLYRLKTEPPPSPRPRELKQLVNQIGARWRRVPSGVPLVDVAYFTLVTRSREDVHAGLVDKRLPQAGLAHLLSDDPQGSLAAMLFNVEASQAAQLLLGDEISTALVNYQVGRFTELFDRPGFEAVLGTRAYSDWAAEGGSALMVAADTLQEADALRDRPQLRASLAHAARSSNSLVFRDESTSGRGAAVLVHERTAAGESFDDVMRSVSFLGDDADEPEVRSQRLACFSAFCTTIAELGHALEHVRVAYPGSRGQAAEALATLAAQEGSDASWPCLEVDASADVISDQVVAILPENPGRAWDAYRAGAVVPERIDLPKLVDGVATIIGERAEVDEVTATGLRILDAAGLEDSADVIGSMTADGTLTRLFGSAFPRTPHVAAVTSLLELRAAPQLPAHGDPALEQAREKIRDLLRDPSGKPKERVLSEQANWLAQPQHEGLVLLTSVGETRPDARPWINEMYRRLYELGALRLTPAEFITRWPELESAFTGEARTELVQGMVVDRNLAAVTAEDDAEQLPLSLVLTLLAVHSDAPESVKEQICSSVKRLLESRSREDWDAAMSAEPSELREISLQASAVCHGISLESAFVGALEAHATRLAGGDGSAWVSSSDEVTALLDLVDGPERNVLAQRVCGAVADVPEPATEAFIAAYGTALPREPLFRTHHELLSGVARKFVDGAQDYGLDWIAIVIEQAPDVIGSQTDQAQVLKRRVEEKLKASAEDDRLPGMLRLYAALGGDLDNLPTDDDEGEQRE